MKRFRPAFVVTVSASVIAGVACNTPPQDPVIGMNPPAPSVNENANPPRAIDLDASAAAMPSATPTTSAPIPSPTATDASGLPIGTSNPPPSIDWADFSGQKALNPVDAQKRTIFSNGPSGCYVILPLPANAPPPTTSFQPPSTKTVPCPKAFQDPIWAECVAGSILPNKTGTECICSPSFGNPPLPPHRIACPKKP